MILLQTIVPFKLRAVALGIFNAITMASLIFFSTCVLAHRNEAVDYLLRPTGRYGVGYQDIFLTNTNICPDAFYQKNINKRDFSLSNKKYCHEVVLRIYYPSRKNLNKNDERYAPPIIETNKWLAKKHNLSKQDVAKLKTILNVKTYTSANVEPLNQKFPIVIFVPGSGSSVQAYNNVVSNLVSNGYIVIGINSLFINGALKLSNGHIVVPPDEYLDVHGREENISDLKFVLDHLSAIKYRFNLEKYMDFNNTGLIGHSRGGMSIVNFLKKKIQKCKNIKSIILMDPGDGLLKENYPLPKFRIPSMTMWSSSFKKDMQGSVLLGRNNCEVVLKYKEGKAGFSDHNNFSDESTLQYHPAYQARLVHQALAVGDGNGYDLAKEVNDYVLTFFNHYLKNDVQKDFNGGFLIKCGQ